MEKIVKMKFLVMVIDCKFTIWCYFILFQLLYPKSRKTRYKRRKDRNKNQESENNRKFIIFKIFVLNSVAVVKWISPLKDNLHKTIFNQIWWDKYKLNRVHDVFQFSLIFEQNSKYRKNLHIDGLDPNTHQTPQKQLQLRNSLN